MSLQRRLSNSNAPYVARSSQHAINRVRLLYGALLVILVLFGLRLFYVQVLKYSYYKDAARSDQFKQYEIPAKRGIIEAHDGNTVVPIVLNQELYTLYADPVYIKDPNAVATRLSGIIGGDAGTYADLMRTPNTRYVVIAKKLSQDQSDKVLALKEPGIGTQGQDYRTYPQGPLAAQLLGFVDSDGQGQYGLEQAMNKQLQGVPGQVKAVTDVNGVPLAATKGNIETAPVDGQDIVTTLSLPIQSKLEQILADEYQKTKSQLLSAIVIDPNTGQIKAMANYPTYDPSNYQNVSDASVYQNAAVSNPIEPGSAMKTLTTAAALDQGVIQPDGGFYDPSHWLLDGFNITDIEEDGGPGPQNIQSILSLSLNTGATWMLMQMSQPGDTQINSKGIAIWRDYMVSHYRFGQYTNIEQGYESPGVVPPKSVPAPELTYANTTFGQGVQVTALQMAAALSSVVNGGTYYQPTLIDQLVDENGHTVTNQPKVVTQHVVKPSVGPELVSLMENVVYRYRNIGFGYMAFPSNYIVGGKTGTAQIASPEGGYYPDRFNGTYIGFVGGDKPQYVVAVYNIEPHVAGYAGANGGQPVFADIVHMLIDNSFVTPKSGQ